MSPIILIFLMLTAMVIFIRAATGHGDEVFAWCCFGAAGFFMLSVLLSLALIAGELAP